MEGSFRKERPFSFVAAAWPEIGGRFSRGRLETFSNWPDGRRTPERFRRLTSLAATGYWTAATSAPIPVCERTYCASNAACSVVAAFELSVTEKSQQQRNDSGIVKIAGDT